MKRRVPRKLKKRWQREGRRRMERRRAAFAFFANDDPPPCRFCGRCVLVGVCCSKALAAAQNTVPA